MIPSANEARPTKLYRTRQTRIKRADAPFFFVNATDGHTTRLWDFHPPASAVPGAETGASTGGRLPRLKSIETLLPAGAVGAADRARSGAERRDRTSAVALQTAAQNGTYACARILQACTALGGLGHAANR